MLRRISKVNDYRDEIKSCPSGVIDDIYEIKYFIGGYDTEIAATFENKGLVLEVIIPSSLLQQLPNGVLYRRASYKVVDTSYPDGYYNLEFIDNMNVWLGDDDVVPQPDPGYVTEEELTETLSDYATLSWISEQGYITSEALSGYATEAWVSEQGFLTSETIPSDIATQSWVENQGYLTSVPSGYATEAWVSSQGYLTSVPSEYATQSWVSEQGYITSEALSGYATEAWVSSQGFLTSETLPSDIATQSWVSSQSYLQSTSLKTINEQSLVGEGDIEIGGLTPEQEEAIEPLEETSEGVLYTREMKQYIRQSLFFPVETSEYNRYLYKVDDDLYWMAWSDLYKYNPENFTFERVDHFSGNYSNNPLWKDNTGRMYRGVTYMLNFNTHTYDSVDLECQNYHYDSNRHTIWKGQYGIYNLYGQQKFDETTQKFVNWTFTAPEGYDVNSIGFWLGIYGFWYGEHYIYFDSSNMWELVEYEDHLEFVLVSTPYIPTTYDGNTLESWAMTYVAGELYYLISDTKLKLNNGVWETVDIRIDEGGYTNPMYMRYQNGSGVVYDDYLIGYEQNVDNGFYTIVNMGTTSTQTYWTPVNQVSVSVTGSQVIFGYKNFKDSVRTSSLYITNVYYGENGQTDINLGKNTITANHIKITSPVVTINNVPAATKEDCITNTSELAYGGTVSSTSVYDDRFDPYNYNFFTTHTGRVFRNYNGGYVEFDGTQWSTVSGSDKINVYSSYVTVAPNNTFYNNSGITYIWNDTTSNFEQICTNSFNLEEWCFWWDGTNLRFRNVYKLVENGGTWSWDDTDLIQDWKEGMYHYVNNKVYVLAYDNYVYEYNPSNKSYTQLGRYRLWTYSSFVVGGDIIYPYNGEVYDKIDFTKVTQQGDSNIYTPTQIPWFDYNYFSFEYDGHLWYPFNYYTFKYCYDIDYTTPTVPGTNGDYILQGTRSNSGVSYSFIDKTDFVESSEVWTGTESQWNLLSSAQQASYKIALITND